MVEDGREGIFVCPDSPGYIADAAVRARDAWPELSEAARERFETAYSPAVVRGQWEALLADTRRTP